MADTKLKIPAQNIPLTPEEQQALAISSKFETNIESNDYGVNLSPTVNSFSPEDSKVLAEEIELGNKYGNSPLQASALGLARGASLGISDQFLIKTGIKSAEEIDERKKRNEISSLLGEVVGTVAPTLASGGSSAIAKAASLTPAALASRTGTIAEKALSSLLKEKGTGNLAKRIVAKSAPTAIGSAVEGSLYSTGELMSENALGKADFNAENIIANAGLGALLGGVGGTIFSAPAALLPIASKSSSGVLKNKLQKLADPVDATLDLYGINASARTKLKNTSATFVDELPKWTVDKAKLGYFTTSDKLKDNILKVKTDAGKAIGNIVNKIDEVEDVVGNIMPNNASIYANIAKKISDEIIDKYKTTPGFRDQLKNVRQLRNEYVELAKIPGTVKAKELHELRMRTDDLIKFDKAPGSYTLKDKTLSLIRNDINDQIGNIAKSAESLDPEKRFGSLFTDLKEANKDFSYASKILPHIERKVEGQNTKRGIFNLTDLVLGGAVADIAENGIGGLVIAGKKLLEGDLRRRAVILSQIEKNNKKLDNSIKKNVNSYFNSDNLNKAVKSSSLKALSLSPLGNTSSKKEEKHEYFAIRDKLNKAISDPDYLQSELTKKMLGLNTVAPETASFTSTKLITAINFLQSKLPKTVSQRPLDVLLKKDTQLPSQLELAKFERYLSAVENPMGAIEDLKNGTFTNESAEALKTVYPEIFKKLQDTVISELGKFKGNLSYKQKVDLSLLLDMTTDPSLEPKNIAGLQANFQPTQAKQESVNPNNYKPNPAAKNLDMASREETQANKISQR